MKSLRKLWFDEGGALVSIELILIVTIAVLALVVGWSEVAHAVNTELDDISNAIGHFNQSYYTSGYGSFKLWGGLKSSFNGSAFVDLPDDCDGNCSGYSSITCFGAGVGGENGGGVCGGGYGGYGGTAPLSHPGPLPINSGVGCPTGDCIPDQVLPGTIPGPVPDQAIPQSPPAGPQPSGLPTFDNK